jgi:putative toxin-antitoxin system antitoxin component (TIGR02293 family)
MLLAARPRSAKTSRGSRSCAAASRTARPPRDYIVLPGLDFFDLPSLLAAIEKGFPFRTFERFVKTIGLPAERVAEVIGLPRRTLARRKIEGKLKADESDRLLRLARVCGAALDLYSGDREAAIRARSRSKSSSRASSTASSRDHRMAPHRLRVGRTMPSAAKDRAVRRGGGMSRAREWSTRPARSPWPRSSSSPIRNAPAPCAITRSSRARFPRCWSKRSTARCCRRTGANTRGRRRSSKPEAIGTPPGRPWCWRSRARSCPEEVNYLINREHDGFRAIGLPPFRMNLAGQAGLPVLH